MTSHPYPCDIISVWRWRKLCLDIFICLLNIFSELFTPAAADLSPTYRLLNPVFWWSQLNIARRLPTAPRHHGPGPGHACRLLAPELVCLYFLGTSAGRLQRPHEDVCAKFWLLFPFHHTAHLNISAHLIAHTKYDVSKGMQQAGKWSNRGQSTAERVRAHV